jgi:hypothetical protein
VALHLDVFDTATNVLTSVRAQLESLRRSGNNTVDRPHPLTFPGPPPIYTSSSQPCPERTERSEYIVTGASGWLNGYWLNSPRDWEALIAGGVLERGASHVRKMVMWADLRKWPCFPKPLWGTLSQCSSDHPDSRACRFMKLAVLCAFGDCSPYGSRKWRSYSAQWGVLALEYEHVRTRRTKKWRTNSPCDSKLLPKS